jgi:hypothetical protein
LGSLLLCALPSLGYAAKPKRTSKSSNKKKKKKYRFFFYKIKLPKAQRSKLFRPDRFKGLRVPQSKRKRRRTGRVRPPTRRIRMNGKLGLSTSSQSFKAGSPRIKRRLRRGTAVKGLASDRRRNTVRLTVYRRRLGRKGWIRRWLGHIFIRNQTIRYLCPRPRFCKELKLAVWQTHKAFPALKRNKRAYAWRLHKALERNRQYEIEARRK